MQVKTRNPRTRVYGVGGVAARPQATRKEALYNCSSSYIPSLSTKGRPPRSRRSTLLHLEGDEMQREGERERERDNWLRLLRPWCKPCASLLMLLLLLLVLLLPFATADTWWNPPGSVSLLVGEVSSPTRVPPPRNSPVGVLYRRAISVSQHCAWRLPAVGLRSLRLAAR